MKILVDKIPSQMAECLFSRKDRTSSTLTDEGIKFTYNYYCRINEQLCDLEKGHKCNKLKVIK